MSNLDEFNNYALEFKEFKPPVAMSAKTNSISSIGLDNDNNCNCTPRHSKEDTYAYALSRGSPNSLLSCVATRHNKSTS